MHNIYNKCSITYYLIRRICIFHHYYMFQILNCVILICMNVPSVLVARSCFVLVSASAALGCPPQKHLNLLVLECSGFFPRLAAPWEKDTCFNSVFLLLSPTPVPESITTKRGLRRA